MEWLQGPKEHARIDTHALYQVAVDALPAHGLVRDHTHVAVVAVYPRIELPGPLVRVGFGRGAIETGCT